MKINIPKLTKTAGRPLAVLLTLIMFISILPLPALAIDGEQVSDTVQTIMPVIQDTNLLPFADNFMAENQNIEYTVHYYVVDTSASVAPSKVVIGQTMGATVTESAIVVAGYVAVAPTSLTKVLAASGNEFIFYYTTGHVYYNVHYYIAGTTTSVAPSKTGVIGLMGATVTESAIVVAGYTVDANVKTLVLAASGNEIIFFYEYKPSPNFVSGFGSNGKFLVPIDAPDPNAIKIYNAKDLDNIRNNLSGSYVLMNNITDLHTINGGQWTPIGDSATNAFRGTFDGQGYVIHNLVVTGDHQYAGLFGYVQNAKITNIGLEETKITVSSVSTAGVGGLFGSGSGSVSVSNCYNVGVIFSVSTAYVGGLFGSVSGSGSVSVSNCYNVGGVSSSNSAGVGGLFGSVSGSGSVSVSNCYNVGDVSSSYGPPSNGAAGVGGLIGSVSGNFPVPISVSNCYNAGDISSYAYTSYFVGGLIGRISGNFPVPISVSNCYNVGGVSSSGMAGGLIGYFGSVSGFGSVSNCYNVGDVSSSNSAGVGGLIGYSLYVDNPIVNCYWNNESVQAVNGIPRIDAEKKGVGTGVDTTASRNTVQMTTREQYAINYVGFDFTGVWGFIVGENDNFPVLRAFYSSVSEVTLNKNTLVLLAGNTETLLATVQSNDLIYPLITPNQAVTWESSNLNVATVDSAGVVKGVSPGSTFIIARSVEDPRVFDICTVTVTPVAVDSILLQPELLITVGNSETLTAVVQPEKASNQRVYWSSSDPDVVSVVGSGLNNVNGVVTAHSGGTATITVISDADPKIFATCEVTVFVPVTRIVLDLTTLEMSIGTTDYLTATILPRDATNKDVYWHSSDESVVTVVCNDGNSLVGLLSAVSIGTTIITATPYDCLKLDDNTIYATCMVTVSEPIDPGAVTGVALNKAAVSIVAGDSDMLRATVTPINAADKSVIWRSSNNAVATVNENGIVTAVSTGTATITVTTNDGKFTANCVVTVQPQSPKVKFDAKNSYIHTDDELTISFSWSVNGSGTTILSVTKNDEPFTGFTQSGNTIDIQPSRVSGLKDVYTIKVSVTNDGGTGSDFVTFEVYKHNALANELNFSINIDNTHKVAGKSTAEIFAIRGELTLSYYLQLDTSSFPWTGYDGLTWQIKDTTIAEVYYLSNGWTKVSSDTVLHPTTLMRIVGYQEGKTTLTVTHKASGMSVDIPISVVTLENKLYLLSTSPVDITEVSYTNGAGSSKTVDTTTFGRSDVAIYEPSGIVGEIKFKGVFGTDLYFGSIRASQLNTGEQDTISNTYFYPLNSVSLRRVTSQTFFTYLPDGRPYNGEVTIYGGLYKNGAFVVDSMRIIGQERIAEGRGGMFRITMDSNDFGSISIGDDLRFAYELVFDNGYAPQLVFVDGFSNNNDNIKLGDAILRLQPWTGQGFTATQYFYQDREVGVAGGNSYVGIDDETGGGVLVANIVTKSGMDVGSFKYADEFGYIPHKQHIVYTYADFPFLSGKYTYLSLELIVDDDLMLKTCETRHYTIHGRDSNGNVQNVDLPFGIVNGAGWVIPPEMLDFNINMAGVTTSNSYIGAELRRVSGGNDVASGILSKVITQGEFDFPNNELPFEVKIKKKLRNPLVYEVKGIITSKKGPNVVYWSIDSKVDSDLHTNQNCIFLRGLSKDNNYESGTMQEATRKGVLGGFCWHCASDLAEKWDKEFDKAKDDYYDYKHDKKHGSGGWSGSAKIIGYLTAEIGYDLSIEKPVFTLTEIGLAFEGKLAYQYSYRIPVSSWPVPVAITIEFATGASLEIGIKALMTNSHIDLFSDDWLVLEAKTNGYVRLRGAAGVDMWVAAANVGVFGQADLDAEFILYLLTFEAAARYKVGATVGVDLSYRVGPPIKLFGRNLYTSGRLVLWEIGKWSTDWKPIGNSDPNLFSSGAQVAGVRAFSTQFTLFNTLASELSAGVPVNQLPADDPVVVGDGRFAVAAWSSVNLSEEELELLTGNGGGQGNGQADVAEVMELMNLSEITVGVFKNGVWLTPFTTLTDNYLPDVSPRVAVFGDKAVVVWQQIRLSENEEGLVITSTDLWYSIYDGAKWSSAQKINASINGVINDYSIAMADSNIAAVLSMYEEYGDGEISESIYTVCVDALGQVTQNKVTVDTNLNACPQIVAVKDGFVFSYYTVDYNGYSDIVLQMIGKDGAIRDAFYYNVNAAAELHGISSSFDYNLVANGNGDVAIVWSAFSFEKEQYVIYAVQLVEINGVKVFTAPTELVGPQEKGATLTLSNSVMDNDGNVNVLYNQIDYVEYFTYLDYVENPQNYKDEVSYPGVLLPASGVFENGFLSNIYTDADDVTLGGDLPVYFSIINTGIDKITKITVVWDNKNIEPLVWDGLTVLPNEVFTDISSVTVNGAVNTIPYTVRVTFGNNEVKTEKGTLVVANPDVSIGKITVLNSDQGRRTFAVNLYSLSNVPLGASDYRVRLSFFKDMTHEVPATVTSNILTGNTISNRELLALIDQGGLSLPFTYEITPDDLNEAGEIPSTGIRLYVTAEIIDAAGNVVAERDYSANNGHVLFESLWRYGQNSIVATATRFDSDSSTVDVAIRNNSMRDVSAGSGRIVALLLDETGKILEVKMLPINTLLRKESLQHYTIAFSQRGYDVSVSYETISNGVSDSALSSLSLSSIPFNFAKNSTAVDGVVKITLNNVYNVTSTSLRAIAKDPSAIITVNGVSYSDVAVTEIQLQKTTNVRIGVTVDRSTTVYELTVLTDKEDISPTPTPTPAPSGGSSGGGGGTPKSSSAPAPSQSVPSETTLPTPTEPIIIVDPPTTNRILWIIAAIAFVIIAVIIIAAVFTLKKPKT